jgi:hypothetical protein
MAINRPGAIDAALVFEPERSGGRRGADLFGARGMPAQPAGERSRRLPLRPGDRGVAVFWPDQAIRGRMGRDRRLRMKRRFGGRAVRSLMKVIEAGFPEQAGARTSPFDRSQTRHPPVYVSLQTSVPARKAQPRATPRLVSDRDTAPRLHRCLSTARRALLLVVALSTCPRQADRHACVHGGGTHRRGPALDRGHDRKRRQQHRCGNTLLRHLDRRFL